MNIATQLGYVADFCPICVAHRVCKLQRVEAAADADVPVALEHQRVCMMCEIASVTDPARYAAIAPQPLPLDDMVQHTFPTLEEAHRPRGELEAQVRADPGAVAAGLRQQLLLEPLLLLSAHVSALPQVEVDGYVANTALPLLRNAFTRLKPVRSEIDEVLATLRAQHSPLSRLVTSEHLLGPAVSISSSTLAPSAGEPSLAGRGMPDIAAWIFRGCGWLFLTAGVLLMLVFLAKFNDSSELEKIIVLAGSVLSSAIGKFLLITATGVERRKQWARGWGCIFAVGFAALWPVGLAVTAFLFWCIIFRWSDRPRDQSEQPA